MTLTEALVVVAFLAILISMILPAFSRARQNSRPSCLNNLNLMGIAFYVWGRDHMGYSPMAVSTNDGGSREYASEPEVYRHFQVMENEFGQSPKVLICPQDKDRFAATNFINFNNSNLSYFLGVTVSNSANTNLFLSGDRNIANGVGPVRNRLWLTTNDLVTWTVGLHTDEKHSIGYILRADGSAFAASTPELRRALKKPGVAPAVVAVP
jgi:hypothetical protein